MIWSIIKRNLTLFFRDKAGVFFSLLGPLIMLVLYVFFLGALQEEQITETMPGASPDAVSYFNNSWIFAGILSITAVTTSLAALQAFVADRASGRFKDFAVSPVKRSKLIVGYLGSAWIISLAITTTVFVMSELYIVASGGDWLSPSHALTVYAIIVFLCLVFSAIVSCLVTFLRSVAAFTSFSVIIGTSSGFLAAIYVPIGSLPTGVANVINLLPFSQAAALLREPFTTQALSGLTNDNAYALSQLRSEYGITLHIGSYDLSNMVLLTILISLSFIFALIAILRMNRSIR